MSIENVTTALQAGFHLRPAMELGKHLRREADAEHCFSPNTCLRVGLDRMAKR